MVTELRNPTEVFHKFDFENLYDKLLGIVTDLLEESGAFGDPTIPDYRDLVHFSPFPPMPTEQNFLDVFPRVTIPPHAEGHIGWFTICQSQLEGFRHNVAAMPLDFELHGCASIGRESIAMPSSLREYSSGYHRSRKYIIDTSEKVLKTLQDETFKFRIFHTIGGTLFAPEHATAEFSWEQLTFMYFYQSRIKFTIMLDLESMYSL